MAGNPENVGTTFSSSPDVVDPSHFLKLDPNHPLYIAPSDHPGMMFVSSPFSGSGFGGWKRNMRIAFSCKNKLGILMGTYPRPPEDSELYEQWGRCNDMAIAWLLNGLDKDIGDSVYSDTASEIWSELNERFGQSNGAKWYQVQKEISLSAQGSSSVCAYYTKLKRLWDELASVYVIPPCSCETRQAMQKLLEGQKLIQFLMGLNESYSAVRSNILLMNPMPSLSTAYSMLMHEEKHKEIALHSNAPSFNSESASFNVGVQRSYSGSTCRKSNSSSNQRPAQHGSRRPSYSGTQRSSNQRVNFDSKSSNVVCRYCKASGHYIDQCPKLRRKENNGGKPQRAAACVEVDDSATMTQVNNAGKGGGSGSHHGFSKEQYEHLLNLFHQSLSGSLEASNSESFNFAGEAVFD